jgi:hypothetical protein
MPEELVVYSVGMCRRARAGNASRNARERGYSVVSEALSRVDKGFLYFIGERAMEG